MSALQLFHQAVQSWFRDRLGSPTDVQEQAWPPISKGSHVLVSAPTGCGKTLAAFLWALDRLLSSQWSSGGIRVLYISPLKALNNDVRRNLLVPLMELERHFLESGHLFPKIEVMTRSGDSTEQERRRLQRKPPEILITTPESLNILLTQKSARNLFSGLKTVILDEIHAVAGSKRGTSLITAMERLVPFAGEFQRIGLSATVNPLQLTADFLGGFERVPGTDESFVKRNVEIVASRSSKTYSIEVVLPEKRPVPEDSDHIFWESLALELKKSVRKATSTLIFTNSRRACEKLARLVNENEPELLAYSHHGSLSKDIRLEVEQKLKSGELSALVATNSLELGIDIGDLDEVILAQTPRSASSAIQKTGRAGHRTGAVSRAKLYPSHGLDSVEAAVITRCILDQQVEPLVIPEAPLDVLAQTVLSALCCEALSEDDLYLRLRGAWPYRNLSRGAFRIVIDMLSGRYAGTRIRELKPRVVLDPVRGTLQASDEVPFLLYSSGGTIPDRGYFSLRDRNTGAKIGELDEEFVWERQLGDTFALGAQIWRIVQVTDVDVKVDPVDNRPQIIPFWKSDEQDRSFFLAEKIGIFLEEAERWISERPQLLLTELTTHRGFSQDAAERTLEFLEEQKQVTHKLPHRHRLICETIIEGKQAMSRRQDVKQMILHTFWGARVNRPWSFCLAQAWEDRYGYALETYAGDDQILILVPPEVEITEVMSLVKAEEIEVLLRKRLESTGFFGARFRESAGRALLLPKGSFGSRQPLWLNRIRSKKLMDAVLRFENFPILLEAWRQCLQDEFEIENMRKLLDEMKTGEIEFFECQTSEPSPFTEGILWRQVNQHMYADDTPEGEKHSNLSDEIWKEVLANDRNRPHLERILVAEWEDQLQQTALGYAPETVEDLLDLLEQRIALPTREWVTLLDATSASMALSRVDLEAQIAKTVVSEKLPNRAQRTFHEASRRFLEEPFSVFLNWLDFYGPKTLSSVSEFWNVDAALITKWAEDEVERGELLMGHFHEGSEELEICRPGNWELLVRRHRLRRREAVRSRPAEDFPLFLAQTQGLTRVENSIEALQSRIEQLFALPLPAALWEAAVLPSRIYPYLPTSFDSLLQNSDLRWFGAGKERILLGFDDEKSLFAAPEPVDDSEQIFLDRAFGASGESPFLDLVAHGQLTSTSTNEKLWSLAWKGVVNNSSFETLRRALLNGFESSPVQEAGHKARRGFQRWAASRPLAGTWKRQDSLSIETEEENPRDGIAKLEMLKERARFVLDRYGIVFRELLAQEQTNFQWRALFPAFKMMELSGELTGGLFFEGIASLQFATAEALRNFNQSLDEEALFVQHAQDPSSVCGLKIDAFHALPRRAAGNWLWWKGKKLCATVTASGKKVELFDADVTNFRAFVERTAILFFQNAAELRHYWTIETIDSQPATESSWRDTFQSFGFKTQGTNLVLWKKI